jgi:hypothetical protein
MTNEQINIAIAEACGWTHIAFNRGWINAGDGETQCVIPDYCNDLNAMHEAEKVLNKKQWVAYGRELSRLNVFPMVHATARQRAEAFLRTLGKQNEKWEEQ